MREDRINETCRNGRDWSNLLWVQMELVKLSSVVAGIGPECLWEKARMVKPSAGSGWNWARVAVETGRIAQTFCWERVGLIQNVYGNRQDWANFLTDSKGLAMISVDLVRIYARANEICQHFWGSKWNLSNLLQEW